jgi:glyoxylase-like metal-dependent hydrolase (beta-lactamase superfamily II)
MNSKSHAPSFQEILPGLLRWKSALSGTQHPVNSYLWNDVLIDPAEDISTAANIAAICVTHVQREHLAGAKNFSATPLLVPARDEYLCAGETAYRSRITTWQEPWDWETRGNYQGHLAGALNERPPLEPLSVAGVLHAGKEYLGLKSLATPGHGKNALTFLAEVEGRKVAFCGDLIYEEGKLWNWFDCDWDYGPQAGQKALLASARRLLAEKCDLLLPAHGEPIGDPHRALSTLIARLEAVLHDESNSEALLNFPEKDSPMHGWHELSPHLHQWKTGNCAALISSSGHALLIDDGLCFWQPEPQRQEHHRAQIQNLKSSLGITHIELCIPTHYHGDHTENIPSLVEEEGTRVLCLDLVADAIEYPHKYNLAAALPWYGTLHDTVPIHQRVESGTTLRWREYELELFHLGGQTFYHAGISARVDGARVLFCGDALMGWNPAPEPVLCWNDCAPQTRGWDYALSRMIEREPELLVCGHGSAIREPMKLLVEKHARWRTRLEEYSALNARASERLFFDPFLT